MIPSFFTLTVLFVTVAEGPKAEPPVVLSMVAVHATDENREEKFYEPTLKEERAALSALPFDTYRRIRTQRIHLAVHEEKKVVISSKYTLYVKPLSKDSSGKVRLRVEIEMPAKKKEAKPLKALSTVLVIPREKEFILRGLELDAGELVIVMALKGSSV